MNRLEGVLGRLGALLGASWHILARLGASGGASWMSEGKNIEKVSSPLSFFEAFWEPNIEAKKILNYSYSKCNLLFIALFDRPVLFLIDHVFESQLVMPFFK